MKPLKPLTDNISEEEGDQLILAPYHPERRNIFITFGGCFFPPHINHFHTYKVGVLKVLGDARFNLLASFMVPSHTKSLSKKLNAPLNITSTHRQAMCRLALKEFNVLLPTEVPPLQLQPFLLRSSNNQGFAKATSVIKETLTKQYKPKLDKKAFKIEQVSLIGADNVGLFEKKIQRGDIVVVVQNRPKQSGIDLQKWLKSQSIAPFSQNVIVAQDLQNLTEISSTQLRSQLQKGEDVSSFVPSSVLQYHAKFKLKYPTETQHNAQTEPINIEDLAPKNLPRIGIQELQPELQEFQSYNSQQENKENILEVGKLLGKGLQAKVRAYFWKKSKVALKTFSLKQSRSRKIRTFEREAQAYGLCMGVKAENVVQCFGVGVLGSDWLYLVLERGEEDNCLEFAKQLLQTSSSYNEFLMKMVKPIKELSIGLHKMGQAKVLHRDLTTDNVLVVLKGSKKSKTQVIEQEQSKKVQAQAEEIKESFIESNFTLKVMDFGVCGHDGLIEKGYGARGSIRYYSPQSAADPQNYTPASDMFSFGLLVHELIHGTCIWPELKKVSQVLEKHDKGLRPQLRQDLPIQFKELIQMTWQENPEQRISFAAFAQRMDEIFKH